MSFVASNRCICFVLMLFNTGSINNEWRRVSRLSSWQKQLHLCFTYPIPIASVYAEEPTRRHRTKSAHLLSRLVMADGVCVGAPLLLFVAGPLLWYKYQNELKTTARCYPSSVQLWCHGVETQPTRRAPMPCINKPGGGLAGSTLVPPIYSSFRGAPRRVKYASKDQEWLYPILLCGSPRSCLCPECPRQQDSRLPTRYLSPGAHSPTWSTNILLILQ